MVQTDFNTHHTPLPRRRRWLLAAASIAIPATLLLGAACDDNGDDSNGDTTPDNGGVPTSPASPSPEMSPTEPGGDNGGDNGNGNGDNNGNGDVPTNAEDYANAAFSAWVSGNTTILSDLVSAQALTTLEENTPEDPNAWTMTGCDGATGQVSCTFESTGGETLTLLIDNEMASAGELEAIVDAQMS